MIEWKLEKANPLRVKLIKATIESLTKQLQDIDDSHLVNAKNPQIFTKVKLDLPTECEVCQDSYTKGSIVDVYDLSASGHLLDTKTVVTCKKCVTKVKAKL